MGREVVTGEEVANQFTTEYPGAQNTPQAATVSKVLGWAGYTLTDN